MSKGGLALYISDAIPYTVRHDLSKNIEGVLESLFVEINPGKSGTLIIGEVYRSPSGSSVTFLQILREILEAIQNQPCETVVMGDFNVNLLDYEGSFPADFLSDMLASGLLPSVTIPTRVTEKSATLIDNIFSSMTFQNSFVIVSDISDHFPVLSDLLLPNMQGPRSSRSTSPYFVTEKNLEALKTKLQECSWEFIDEKDDLDSSFDKFYSKVKDCFIECCTRRPSNQPRRKNEPFNRWMTEGLLTSSSRKLYL